MMPGISRMALHLTTTALFVLALTLPGASHLAHAAGPTTKDTASLGPQPIPPLPTPAPDAAEAALQPEQWQQSEISDAKRTCAAVAEETTARFEVLPPRRKGACGAPAPIRLESIGGDAPVRFVPAPVVTCDLVAGLAQWIERGLKPLAERHLDSAVSEVRVISSYSCRTRYGKAGARMSEHAFANALDIAGFHLADGRDVKVLDDWGATRRDLLAAAGLAPTTADPILPPAPTTGPAAAAEGSRAETETADTLPPIPVRRPLKVAARRSTVSRARLNKTRPAARPRSPASTKGGRAVKRSRSRSAPKSVTPGNVSGSGRDAARFLRESHKVACAIFGTTLGPEANEAHRNHFHVDMFPRRNRGYCE
jgi:hypothetical protein